MPLSRQPRVPPRVDYINRSKHGLKKSDYGTYIRSGAYIDVADEGDDLLFAATYDVYKSDNMFFNEKTKRMEPILFALITDMEMTDENTDVTTVTRPGDD